MKLGLRQRLKSGEVLFGTFIKMTDPSSAEIIGLLDFDFAVVDNEHVAMNKENIVNIIRASENVGLSTIIRTKDTSKTDILQFLDSGAVGVQVPNVNKKADAEKVIDAVKYSPAGSRGFAPSHRAANYNLINKKEFIKNSNDKTLTVIHCESKESLDNLEAILTVNNIDVVFIGPMDLSQAFNVPGDVNDSNVVHAIETIISITKKYGKALGTVASDTSEAERLIEKGFQYIAISSDQGFIINGAKSAINELKRKVKL
ncbi:HpcH/HpaI aldolase family protein [Salisediminibacterium beveridgei]|uniref:4-hydroxy-2-oxo-heptane-1,7-dioate aldolase n=1 Tax=Salisediminibacterium beveridgei TaxID=632773 RepID=A0A1D7QX11_9BACI|nr:aldolase/citrate lyase family protein [Salisediminibacterium beveridgei]AOM83546.1 4-hydroxy-2-oxo-heptane-1,7-dioate aldolase [Salisediminibacterium beveridgei]